MTNKLKFSVANAKIRALAKIKPLQKYLTGKRKVYSLDLLSGYSCPFADKCLSKVVLIDGKRKIQDGKNTEFRCFSASQEVLFTNLYKLRKHNFDLLRKLRSVDDMFSLIEASKPKNFGILRIDVAGDIFNQTYFDTLCKFANSHTDCLIYAYTKSLPYWVARLGDIPKNFILTASYGGRRDDLIPKHNLRSAIVVKSEAEAKQLKLPIDHDDSHAANPRLRNKSFALLIHGTQPAGTPAAAALKALKGKGSYSR